MGNPQKSPPVLLYLVTEDWYFLSHRLPMARAAKRAGYEVHVVTNVDKGAAAIEAEGFHLHPVSWRRGSVDPLAFLASIRAVRRIYRLLDPDIVHHVALQPTIVGSLAATGLRCRRVNALTGLGFAFSSDKPQARLARPFLRMLLRAVLGHARAVVLVQHPDDGAAVQSLGIDASHVVVIYGSGVEIDVFVPLPEPAGPVTVGYAGRLLEYKGVRTLVNAHELLRRRGEDVRLLIAGDPDPANPSSILPREIAEWRSRPGLTLLGHVRDIRTVWKDAHIAALPSRREGVPRSLLEAAACGRPIIATDVPGCREIARRDVNALLVPPDDPEALADAIARLARDVDMRRRFGAAGRRLVEEEFGADRIGREICALYDRILGRK